MPTPEQIRRMRELYERRKEREAQLESAADRPTGGLYGRVVKPVIESPEFARALEGPRRGVAELIQRGAELGEVGGPRSMALGGLSSIGQAAQLGRESLSDILDIAADVPGSPIPEGWGERMDPSQDTEIGGRILAEKEARIREKGGEPLTYSEEYDIITQVQDEAMPWLTERHGPKGFVSTRGLMEAGGEVGLGVASWMLPPLGAAKTLATGAKLASKAGPFAPAVRAGTRGVAETIMIPRRIEQLGDAIVGKPLGLGLKWGVIKPTVAGGRVSMNMVRNLTNRFKSRAIDEGLPPEKATAEQVRLAQQAVDEGRVKDMPPGHKVTAADLEDNTIPKTVYGTDAENMMGITDVPMPTMPTNPLRRWVTAKFEVGVDSVREGIRRNLPGPYKEPSRAIARLGRTAKEAIGRWTDDTQNKIETWAELKSRRVSLIVDMLEETGIIRPMGRLSESQAQGADQSLLSRLRSGESYEGVRLANDKANYVFTDDYFTKSQDPNINRQTFRTRTLAQDSTGRIAESPDMAPGFADVVERYPEYTDPLRAIKDIGFADERKSAYEWIQELSAIGKEMEGQDRALGLIVPEKQAFGIQVAHFPRGVLMTANKGHAETGLSPAAGKATRDDYHRQYVSQGQAIQDLLDDPTSMKGAVYVHPAEAVRDHARNIGRAIRERKYAEFVTRFADEHDLKHGTIFELLGRSTDYQAYQRSLTNMAKIVATRLHRMSERQKFTQVWVPGGKATLPRRLAGAGTSYRDHALTFDSDIDRALYIVAQKTPSEHDGAYLTWLRSLNYFSKSTTGAIRNAGAAIRKNVSGDVAGMGTDKPVTISASNISNLVMRGGRAGGPDPKPTKRGYSAGRYKKTEKPIVQLAKRFLKDVEADDLDLLTAGDNPGDGRAYLDELAKKRIARNITLREIEEKLMAPSQQGEGRPFRKQQGELSEDTDRVMKGTTADLDTWKVGPVTPAEMGGHQFPWEYFDEISNAFKDMAGVEDPFRGKMGAFYIVQGFLKQIGATADLSSPGIQGLAALWNDAYRMTAGRGILHAKARLPGERGRRATAELTLQSTGNAFTAIKTMVNAGFRTQDSGERVANEMYSLFDTNARKTGTLTSVEWGQDGLAIRGTGVDYTLGARSKGWAGKLGRAPLLKQAERMFNFYGNQIRLYGANRELELQMVLTGKTVKQLVEDGATAGIASAMNAVTGVGRRRFMGNFGQFIFFAPSFFNARLRVVGQMLKGTPTERFVARRYIGGFLSMSTMTTFALNEAMGEETDINPWSFDSGTGKWRFNPNFMRVKMGDLHISLYGPWDTLLRIASMPAFVALNQRLGWDKAQLTRDLRSTISAPITGIVIENITSEDAIGRKSGLLDVEGGPSVAEYFGEHLTPFAWQEILGADPGAESLVERTVEGTTTERVEAAGQLTLQMFGGKSSYETPYETMQKAFAEIIELGPDDPRIQEAFGATQGLKSQEQLREFYAEFGKGFFESGNWDWNISLRHIGKDRTPSFDDIARDITGNLTRMIEEGRFSEVMTPQELEDIKSKTRERLQRSAKQYDRYRVERDRIVDDGKLVLTTIIDAFEAGEKKIDGQSLDGIGPLLDLLTKKKREASRAKAALTAPGAEFEGVRDIFDYAKQTALGNISSSDKNLFDTVEAMYYDLLYGAKSVIGTDTKEMDWDAYEERLKELPAVVSARFPDLNPIEVNTMVYRVQEAGGSEMPPIVEALFKAKSVLSDNKWHDGYDLQADAQEKLYPGEGRPAIIKTFLRTDATGQKQDREKHPWLQGVVNAVARYRVNMRSGSETVDGIAALLSKTTSPETTRGKKVRAILDMQRDKTTPDSIDDWLDFISAVYRGEPLDRYLSGVSYLSVAK